MLTRPAIALLLIGLLSVSACEERITAPQPETPPGQPDARIRGVIEIRIAGISSPNPVASARMLSLDGSEPGIAGTFATAAARMSPASIRALTAPPGDGFIQMDQVTTASFTEGTRPTGFRYVSATYRVRNAHAGGTPYSSERHNLTFVAVSDVGTLGGTAISQLNKFNGDPITDALLPPNIRPSGWAYTGPGAFITAVEPDVFQAFREDELPANPPGLTLLPYGFVVKSMLSPTDRVLPVISDPSAFDGLVTFAFKVPLRSSAAEDAFTISAHFVAMDDNDPTPIVTQSFEEADGQSEFYAYLRSLDLGATLRSVVGTVHGAAEHVCDVRIAGVANAPSSLLGPPVASMSRVTNDPVAPREAIPSSTVFEATFCAPMAVGTPGQVVFTGSLGTRSPTSSGTMDRHVVTTAPTGGVFAAGEQVDVTFPTTLQSKIGSAFDGYSTRFRMATAPSGMQLKGLVVPVGNEPRAIAVGDINGDTRPDVLTANTADGTVSVLLRNANGKLVPTAPITVGAGPRALALVDLDADTDLDLVVPNYAGNTVAILLNDGFGGFSHSPQSPLAVANGPVAIAVGDVNGADGVDIVIASASSTSATVALGDGDGSFTVGTPVAMGVTPIDVLLTDANNDSKQDIVSLYGAGIAATLGDGLGGFGTVNTAAFLSPFSPVSFTAGDPDGDGDIDILVAGAGVEWIVGNGNGTFSSAGGLGSEATQAVVVANINGDGFVDIVLAGGSTNTIIWWDGSDYFSSAYYIPVGDGRTPTDLAMADLDGDGDLDLVTANRDGDNVSVITRKIDGSLTGETGPAVPLALPATAFATADFNADGVPDFATIHAAGALQLVNGVTFAFQDAFVLPGVTDIATGDFNGDAKPDIVTVVSNALVVQVVSNFVLTTAPGSPISVPNAISVTVGDINSDGKLDIAALSSTGSGNGQITVLLGNGAGAFTPAGPALALGSAPAQWPTMIRLGDMNNDGRLDIAGGNGDSGPFIMLGDGNGGFGEPEGTVGTAYASSKLDLGDVNGDGQLDIVASSATSDHVLVILGDCTCGFFVMASGSPQLIRTSGAAPGDIRLGDVDGDGDLDIALAYSNSGGVDLWLGNGAGEFTPLAAGPISLGVSVDRVGFADLDNDGTLDIVATTANGFLIKTLNQ